MPRYYIQWCNFAGFSTARAYEVVITGDDAIAKNKKLQQNYLPTSIILGSTNDENFPLLEGKVVAGRTLIYVCYDKVCKRPEENVETAIQHILKTGI
jgi:uncharacterized protein